MTDAAARTPLHDLHVELGARMVEFAGTLLPVQYPAGVKAEHLHTRAAAGLFDVSHMGQALVTGAGAARDLEGVVPSDVAGLGAGRQRYTVLTNERGGIMDDLIVANLGDGYHIVCNAACKERDLAHVAAGLGADAHLEVLDGLAMVALQGPRAAAVLEAICAPAVKLRFMEMARLDVGGIACTVSRSGYTGEDGFELSMAAGDAEALARRLLAHPDVAPIGLGARDSLRLEAGLCLYGHDLDEDTTPVEAGLTWTMQKVRRAGGAREGGFPGADRVLAQLAEGVSRRRVGILPEGRAPVRDGVEILHGGRPAGAVTSGGFGPTLGGPMAMGYVASEAAATGTALEALVRGRALPARVVDLPFVPHRYRRG